MLHKLHHPLVAQMIKDTTNVRIVYLVEDGHHRLLDNLVFQRGDAQRPLPAIGLRYVHSSRGLHTVSSTVYAAMKFGKPSLQALFILLPTHSVYSRRCATL